MTWFLLLLFKSKRKEPDPAKKAGTNILGWQLWGNHGFNKDMISVTVA
jgi:hypothetical protein